MQGKSLRKFLGDCIYIIQDYQRGYSWEDRHLDDLYQDIMSLTDAQKHYSGTIVLKSIPSELSQYSCASLVDGQQRLTTLMILISSILTEAESRELNFLCGERIKFLWNKFIFTEIKDVQVFYLKNASKEQNEFLSIIIGDESFLDKKLKLKIYHKRNNTSAYQINMMNALNFFERELRKIDDQKIDRIFDIATNKLIFNILEVENDFDECSMFESINYRGKKITVFEGVKNRLIQICNQYCQKTNEIRTKINNAWATTYEILGSSKTILDEDDFLSCHTIVYFGFKNKGSLEDFLLKNKFSIKNIPPNAAEKIISQYIGSILMSAKCWGHMKRVKKTEIKHLDQDSEVLLDKIHCLDIPSHFNPIILSSLMICMKKGEFDFIDINGLLKEIERYCFIYHKLINNRSNFNSKIQNISTDILKENINISGAIDEIFELIHRDEYSNMNDDYLELHKKIARDSQARFMTGDGWARWPSIKYVILNYLNSKHGGTINFKSDFDEARLEKIYAPNDTQTKESKNIFNDIGNMTIHEYESDLSDQGDFRNAIISRGEEIINFIFNHWNIPCGTYGNIQVDTKEFLSSGVKKIKAS